MVRQEILDYIKQARGSGTPDSEIRASLSQKGFPIGEINEAFSGSPVASGLGNTPAGSNMPSMAGNFFDAKTKDTVIWALVGYFAYELIKEIVSFLAMKMFIPQVVNIYGVAVPIATPGVGFNFGTLIINTLLGGIITGLILAKLWSKLKEFNLKFLGNYLHNLFRWIFVPYAIGSLLTLILGGGLSVGVFGGYGGRMFMIFLLDAVAVLVGAYVYAKIMVNKLGHYYQ